MLFGFFITIGGFGSGKTQNTTAYLKASNPAKEVNVTNYYTGYTDFQIQSHEDIINMFRDIYDYHQYFSLVPELKKLYKHKRDTLLSYFRGDQDENGLFVGGFINFLEGN